MTPRAPHHAAARAGHKFLVGVEVVVQALRAPEPAPIPVQIKWIPHFAVVPAGARHQSQAEHGAEPALAENEIILDVSMITMMLHLQSLKVIRVS